MGIGEMMTFYGVIYRRLFGPYINVNATADKIMAEVGPDANNTCLIAYTLVEAFEQISELRDHVKRLEHKMGIED